MLLLVNCLVDAILGTAETVCAQAMCTGTLCTGTLCVTVSGHSTCSCS